LLNYLTSPNVVVWSAICCSTALPGIIAPGTLMKKTESGKIKEYYPSVTKAMHVDGSVAGDLPMKRIAELFNVNTFIVSQVNPHIVGFAPMDVGSIVDNSRQARFTRTCLSLFFNTIDYYISQLAIFGLVSRSLLIARQSFHPESF
jgi:TAG lipase / steryl ester hydrolase / phospholipase A2 / LPA acyltransferase